MSGKASRAMIATMLGSLALIFGAHSSLYPSAAKAFAAAPTTAEEESDGEVLKIAMDMKLAEKHLEALVSNDVNLKRFFDPTISMGLVDRDLLVKMVVLQLKLLEEFDENIAEPIDAEEGDVDLEDRDEMGVEDQDHMEVEQPEKVEDHEVKQLDNEELMTLAIEMKAMEQAMEDLLIHGDGSWILFTEQVSDKTVIDRPLLLKLVLLRESLLDAFDERIEEN